ncbi:MAG: hypothetical protein ACREDY_11740, partial [Bradyrhizobium sp.]
MHAGDQHGQHQQVDDIDRPRKLASDDQPHGHCRRRRRRQIGPGHAQQVAEAEKAPRQIAQSEIAKHRQLDDGHQRDRGQQDVT